MLDMGGVWVVAMLGVMGNTSISVIYLDVVMG